MSLHVLFSFVLNILVVEKAAHAENTCQLWSLIIKKESKTNPAAERQQKRSMFNYQHAASAPRGQQK